MRLLGRNDMNKKTVCVYGNGRVDVHKGSQYPSSTPNCVDDETTDLTVDACDRCLVLDEYASLLLSLSGCRVVVIQVVIQSPPVLLWLLDAKKRQDVLNGSDGEGRDN